MLYKLKQDIFLYNSMSSELREALKRESLRIADGYKQTDTVLSGEFLTKLQLLIEKENENKDVALMMASFTKNREILEFLIENGADVNAKNNDGWTILMLACRWEQIHMVEMLLKNGADVNAKHNKGNTALMIASFTKNLKIVEFLIEKGADVNAKDKYGETAHMRCRDSTIVELLLKNGADVNAKNNDGWTILMLACRWGHLPMVEMLLKNGADVNAKDNEGNTALMIAIQYAQNNVFISMLLDNGADVNAKRKDGDTVLMIIVSQWDDDDYNEYSYRSDRVWYEDIEDVLEITQMILDKGADVYVRTSCDIDAFYYANHHETVELLKNHIRRTERIMSALVVKKGLIQKDNKPLMPYAQKEIIHRIASFV